MRMMDMDCYPRSSQSGVFHPPDGDEPESIGSFGNSRFSDHLGLGVARANRLFGPRTDLSRGILDSASC
jgi:hypothetical protein